MYDFSMNDFQKKLFAWTKDEDGDFSTYQNRLKALRKKKREIELTEERVRAAIPIAR